MQLEINSRKTSTSMWKLNTLLNNGSTKKSQGKLEHILTNENKNAVMKGKSIVTNVYVKKQRS